MRFWKKSMLSVLTVILSVSLAACGTAKPAAEGTTAGENTSAGANTANPLAGKKIALIMQINLGTFSAQYIEGVKEQVEKLGGKVTVTPADGDLAKMSSNLDAAINQKVDGILIDHGTAEALEAGVRKAIERKIPVVAFDGDINVPGVTVLQQDDAKMAEATLERLASDIGGKGNIVKIWVAGFAPMERRQIAYKAFQDKYKDIKEVAAFGAASQNTALDTQAQMEAILKKYPNKGDIAAVWASWDEFAKGAARAIQQAGRTEIKVYGIDMSDEDLQMIQDPNSPWIASSAVDPKDIGRIQVRYLYQKLHGDQTPDKVVLEPVFVARDQLPKEQISTAQLSEHVKGWGNSQQGYTDWLKAAETPAAK
ncbi:sugar ABC transporter substrate-binding protein [Paenibacillus mucilaginosus]|uniref:Ribose ABC transporter ribose-binding protein n=2 Tax=Paenibacillus mucilaginosus TaxID=61624 RepID=H6NIR9_9BACL|nr:sugar ABC transporter substrate-binding protein [Paenibacillus mucilaginosus]AEI45424.1 ribose ABC transporter, ribose-binding protein [Paenibacillus mucilaginosus KNP414]AFC33136.1 ribose ABC transporter ribose-binding protein [Paenibacillus mucilaginosus 3016]MCG7215188.1 sugar ABC transporter substrate-binding protein [Paenibacillus mucilaginosus]WDM26859.1 sugar ABC transporter substrate-binding protein [Paenibacillus mucilaginosus]WFA21568.1 sugar ABC transporter substrate-binding prot